jgi:DNA repair protein RecO (recombination protein O)
MLYKTQGIVLSHIKYGETSIIARIFTARFGQQSYIIHGVRRKKPKYSAALFQPLVPLDMVVYHKKTTNIQRIAEVRCHTPISNILGDFKKSAIVTFLAEFLAKALYEEETNDPLFSFLLHAIIELDKQLAGYETFHIGLMLQLSQYLGFGIRNIQDITLQLARAGFCQEFSQVETSILDHLLKTPLGQANNIQFHIHKATIRKLTNDMLHYYQLHIDNLYTLRSLKILQELSN